MATFYIQLENKLLQISGDLTAENISKALGYVPVSPNVTNELSQRVDTITFDSLKDNPLLQDGSGELNIVDEAGNIIAKIDNDGLHSVDFIAGEHILSEKADKKDIPTLEGYAKLDDIPEVPSLDGYATESWVEGQNYAKKDEIPSVDFNSLENNPLSEDGSGELNMTDESGNVGFKLNEQGLFVKDVIADKHVLSNKVDKEEGKGLSTEDFTSILKIKLEGLNNYDDTELSNALSTLRSDFDKLVGGDTTTAIKTFNEVIAFLDGIQDTQDLSSIIASIGQQIAGKQDALKSGENIKTINGESIVGKGDITIPGIPGEKGDKGDKGDTGVGVQSVAQTTTSNVDGGSNVVTVALTDGSKSTFIVKNGSKGSNGTNGKDGADGEDGATFTPSVDSAGNLSWSNNKGLTNPPTVNIKGPKGDKGDSGSGGGSSSGSGKEYIVVEPDLSPAGSEAYISNIMPNATYIVSDGVSLLSINDFSVSDALSDEYNVIFKADMGGTTLTISSYKDPYWANGVIPTMEGGAVYELSIQRVRLGVTDIFNAVLTPFKLIE